MWSFKKKGDSKQNSKDQAYAQFQQQILNNYSQDNNSNLQQSNIENQFQNQSISQAQSQPNQEALNKKNVFIQKDVNGYAIIFYLIIILAFIVYFVFLR